jgi:hypothetical protein
MKNAKLILIILGLVLVAACGTEAPAPPENTETPVQQPRKLPNETKVILIINEKQYTNRQLRDFIDSRYPDASFVDSNPRITSRLFDTFIEHKMVMYMVDREDIPVTNTEIDNYLRERHLPLNLIDDQMVKESVKAQKYLNIKLYKNIDVTDAEIREYYNKNQDEYRKSSEVFLHQIVVKDSARAYEIHQQLMSSPQLFAQIAEEESIARDANNGGQMGYFEKGTLPKDMEDVVFALSVNQISPVVKSPYGYHIFKVSKIKTERLQYLDSVKDKIKNNLLSDKLRWAYEDFLTQLKSQLNIEIKYPSLYFTYHPIKGEQNETEENTNSTNIDDNNSD